MSASEAKLIAKLQFFRDLLWQRKDVLDCELIARQGCPDHRKHMSDLCGELAEEFETLFADILYRESE